MLTDMYSKSTVRIHITNNCYTSSVGYVSLLLLTLSQRGKQEDTQRFKYEARDADYQVWEDFQNVEKQMDCTYIVLF